MGYFFLENGLDFLERTLEVHYSESDQLPGAEDFSSEFDPGSMSGFLTPGISLFMQLPGPMTPGVALDVLFAEARALADALGGVIEDQHHSTLTQQTMQHMREQVQRFSQREAATRARR